MKTVRIEKTKLVEILTANAATHATEFDSAFKAWQKAQHAALVRAIPVVSGVDAATFELTKYTLPRPDSHSVDYARALKKLSLSADDVIELDEQEYRQYVEDEWAWQRVFKHLVGTYTG